jgi:hemin uptake protein HemP
MILCLCRGVQEGAVGGAIADGASTLDEIVACRDRPVTDHELRTTSLGRITAPLRPRVSSHDLFRGGREVVIVHGRREYLLRITRTDKLILTK